MKQNIFVLSLTAFGAFSAHAQITLNGVPERAVGSPQLTVSSAAPNLVEGREFFAPQAVALDTSVNPPILYVSDYVNNRVLAWKNSANFKNGQPADLAIGQPDLATTFPEGPAVVAQAGRILIPMPTAGLNSPSGLSVDKNGNLYVADAGNNRILRYPTPFAQTGQYPVPDMAIGQPNLNSYGPNYPAGNVPTAQGLLLSSGGTKLTSSLAFDSSGNLWAIDTGNARVLEFTAGDLSGTGSGISASLEIGQPSLTQKNPALANSPASYYNRSQFFQPTALGFDPGGNLFVGDLNPGCNTLPCGRVLVFPGPNFSTNMSAYTEIYGIFAAGYTYPTGAGLTQALLDQTGVYDATGFFFPSAGTVGVVDAAFNRIMIFPSFTKWPTDGSPASATTIFGQANACPTLWPNQTCKAPNNGSTQGSSNSTFSAPGGAASTATDLYLADSGNNRVLDLPLQAGIPVAATRVLGQDYFNTNSPNLIEGREFQFSGTINGGNFLDAGIAIDNSTGTPHLYIADPYNNRVLGFKDLRIFQNGARNQADIVLGQADFTTALVNYPSGSANTPSNSSLYRPVGLLVDAQGNLYVADSLNGRVLRFPAPFAYTGKAPEPADLVLGQQNFTSIITDASKTNMAIPYGLAFTPSCNPLTPPCPTPNGLLVSDQSDNRVLYIPTNSSGTFAAGTDNGKAATIVFGQPGFNSPGAGNSLTAMNNPHHISCDTGGLVYVADTGNNRILIFPDPHSAGTAAAGANPSASISGLSSPESVYVSPVTGEIWVGNTLAGDSLRYANFTSVQLGLGSISGIVEASGNFGYHPLDVIQDQYGDLFVADDAHRVAMYYPGVNLCNSASFLPTSPTSSQYPSANCLPLYDSGLKSANEVLPSRPLAPGAIATIFPCNNCSGSGPTPQFLTTQNAFNGTYPVPPKLGDVEVLVNNVPAPLYLVYPGQINFIVPNATPPSGNADLEVIQVSTGQILGAAQVPMASVAPGAFPYPGGQTGATVYAAALNYAADGTASINSATNPAQRGQLVSLYLTGEGVVPGAPPDGAQAPAPISAQYPVTVYLNGIDVNSPTYGEQNIQHVPYSGINVYLPGIWQINVLIPKNVVPANGAVWFAVVINNTANWDATSPFKTYIYVK